MALLTTEQTKALESLTQRERIDVVLNVLVRRLEKDYRQRALASALQIVTASETKAEAIAQLEKVIKEHPDA